MQRVKCPCCGFPTLDERDAYEICVLCKWQDDGQDDLNADEV
ncbi:CPCC family cysteine-rich protein [Peribacillus sp. FSL H8-0477]